MDSFSNTSLTDLGITVSRDLSWSAHIEKIVTKANKTLGLIKRVCGQDIFDASTRKLLFYSLVRPRLEYASNLWSPHTAKLRRLIENVQRRATKFILNYPPPEMCYGARLATLDLHPLEFRRDISDLVLLFKYKFGSLNVNFKKYFVPVSSNY